MKRTAILSICAFLLFSCSALAQKWEKFTTPDYLINRTLEFAAVQGAPYVVLWDGLYQGNNGGTQWEKIRSIDFFSSGYYFFDVNYESGRIYFNGGIDSMGHYPIFESPDLGKTWNKLNLFPTLSNGFWDLAFIGDTLYTIQYFGVYKIFGPGQPPQAIPGWPSATAGQLYDLTAEGNNLWITTPKGAFHSPDAGYSWQHSLVLDTVAGLSGSYEITAFQEEVFVRDKIKNRMFYSDDRGGSWSEIPWTNRSLFFSGVHIYTNDPLENQFLLRVDGNPFAGDTIWVKTQRAQNIKGIGEYDETLWAGSNTYGVLSKNAGEETWQVYNNGFIYAWDELAYNNGYLFSRSPTVSISADNGDTWDRVLDRPFLFAPNRIGNTFYGLLPGSLMSCPANGRFEWKTEYAFPSSYYTFTQTSSGDTAVVACNPNGDKVYRTVDRGQSWKDISANIRGQVYFWKGKLYGFSVQDSTCVVSDDLGDTWTQLYKFPVRMHPTRYSFHIYGDTFFVTYPQLQRLYYSADGGQSFDLLPIPQNPGSLFLRLWIFEKRLCLGVDDGQLYTSVDAGQTWSALPFTEPGKIFSFSMITNDLVGNSDILFYSDVRLRLDQLRQLSGAVFLDLNGNGQWGGAESGLDGQLVRSAKTGALGTTYNNGHFSMLLGKTADTLRVVNVPQYYSAVPTFKLVPAGQTAQPVQFALKPQGQINDAAVSMASTAVFRAGYASSLYVKLENKGTVPLAGQLKLALDPLLTLLSSEPMADAQIGDTLIWEYANLKPLQVRKFRIDVRTAVVPPGAPVQVFAQTLNGPDVDEADNHFLLDAKVQSSYDPNDKAVSHETVAVDQLSEGELVYTIRFQNLGNIATDFITIRDTLSNAIDASSIRALQGSHKYTWSLEESRILVFRFNPIALTPVSTDSLRSQGFVQFAARLRNDLQVGADIANTAHIYFDFNPAVVTNTVHTVIQTVATLEPANQALQLEVFPNPAREQVTLRLPEALNMTGGRVEIFSTTGKLVLVQQIREGTTTVDVYGLSAGTYWCRWQQEQRSIWGKLIVVH